MNRESFRNKTFALFFFDSMAKLKPKIKKKDRKKTAKKQHSTELVSISFEYVCSASVAIVVDCHKFA